MAVFVSVTTLDDALKRVLEPRAASPQARLGAIRALADVGGAGRRPAGARHSGNDRSRDGSAARGRGRRRGASAGFLLLRLPYEVAQLFEEWLRQHFPDRAERVLNRVREMRGGRLNDPRFGHRMRGAGPYAEILAARFEAACRRHGLASRRKSVLDTSQFIGDLGTSRAG